MLSSEQIRAARALIGWSAQILADEAGVGVATVRRIEAESGVPSSTAKVLSQIQIALEKAGVEFIGSPQIAPGVRLHLDRQIAKGSHASNK